VKLLLRIRPLLSITALLCLVSMPAIAFGGQNFSVKEYDKFHDVLHPLEHEALPHKDFRRIRSNAAELVKRGKAIVKIGVPGITTKTNVEDFRKELRKFHDALNKFSKDAKAGSDSVLEMSFGAVHDSFEMLVGMLPRK